MRSRIRIRIEVTNWIRIRIEVRSWIRIRIKVKIQKFFRGSRAVEGRGRSQKWGFGGYKWSPGGFVNEEQDPDSHLSDADPAESLTWAWVSPASWGRSAGCRWSRVPVAPPPARPSTRAPGSRRSRWTQPFLYCSQTEKSGHFAFRKIERKKKIKIDCQLYVDFKPAMLQDQWMLSVSRFRVRIDLDLMDPDWKLTINNKYKTDFQPFKIAFVPPT